MAVLDHQDWEEKEVKLEREDLLVQLVHPVNEAEMDLLAKLVNVDVQDLLDHVEKLEHQAHLESVAVLDLLVLKVKEENEVLLDKLDNLVNKEVLDQLDHEDLLDLLVNEDLLEKEDNLVDLVYVAVMDDLVN